MIIFLAYWIWVILGILSMVFCKLFFHKYDYKTNKYITFKLEIWQWLAILLWSICPMLNWVAFMSAIIIRFEYDYEVNELFIKTTRWDKFIKFLHKSI